MAQRNLKAELLKITIIIIIITSKVCEMFVYEHTETIEYIKN